MDHSHRFHHLHAPVFQLRSKGRLFHHSDSVPAMSLGRLSELARGLLQLVLPNACLLCDTPDGDASELRHGLCQNCAGAVTTDTLPACPRCAATVGPHTDTTDGCLVCRTQRFGFDAAFRLGVYEGRLRDAILRIKSNGGEGLAEMMGRLLIETLGTRLRKEGVEVVVPIPLHWRRRFLRGHNQAAGFGREAASGLGARFAYALGRVRHTPQQVQPSATARRENVKGAFSIRRRASVSGRTVLLVDDVMTTGSTLSEAARTLKGAGARRVVAAVLARH